MQRGKAGLWAHGRRPPRASRPSRSHRSIPHRTRRPEPGLLIATPPMTRRLSGSRIAAPGGGAGAPRAVRWSSIDTACTAGWGGGVRHRMDGTRQRLERDVAVKLLPRERVCRGPLRARGPRRGAAHHPGIVTLYEAAVDDDGAYLVSELVRGHDARRAPRRGPAVGPGHPRDRDRACDALCMHTHAGVSCTAMSSPRTPVPGASVPPAQVAKLTDFGVARMIGADATDAHRRRDRHRSLYGAEQADGLQAGAPADLYSLALVIYEALTGVNPVGDRPRPTALADSGASARAPQAAREPPARARRRDRPGAAAAAEGTRERSRSSGRRSMRRLDEVGIEPGGSRPPWTTRRPAADGPSRRSGLARRRRTPLRPARAPGEARSSQPEGQPVAPMARRRAGCRVGAGVAAWLAATCSGSTLRRGSRRCWPR